MRFILIYCISVISFQATAGQDPSLEWAEDLSPITAQEWDYGTAAHLLERAGFGGTPNEIQALSDLSPEMAVTSLFNPGSKNSIKFEFNHSGVHDPDLEPFPPSRPAATKLARETGEAMGVKVKPSGNRKLQPVVDRFFYWLRASRLETHRLSYWWAFRMLNNPYPLDEKISLFWHGHFATSETKVRDYRKLYLQNLLFREKGLGSFRDLMVAVAKDPAMLSFLDAGNNVKGSPNENFAREVMELFTMGVGNYSEEDIREAARAFTGWNYIDLKFVINQKEHDDDIKTIFGITKNYTGEEVIDLILEQEITAQYLGAKIYRYFVGDEISESFRQKLGNLLQGSNYNIGEFLKTIMLSKDFYSPNNRSNRIKSPVELVISTYKKLGMSQIPGVPDFNVVTKDLGQQLFFPPTVAGWSQGRSWITPGLLLARGNFIYDLVFPDINFIPPDRYPQGDYKIRDVNVKLALGQDVTTATSPSGVSVSSMSMMLADRDEDFNTRLGSYRGWQKALQRVKPIPRTTAEISLTEMIFSANCKNARQAVEYLARRFLSVPIDSNTIGQVTEFLIEELGTFDLNEAETYMEEGLRLALHVLLSLPEYQLG